MRLIGEGEFYEVFDEGGNRTLYLRDHLGQWWHRIGGSFEEAVDDNDLEAERLTQTRGRANTGQTWHSGKFPPSQ